MMNFVRRQITDVRKSKLQRFCSVLSEESFDDFTVKNEPVLSYLKGSPERAELEKTLEEMRNTTEDVPIVIEDQEFRTNQAYYQKMPHDHCKKIARYYHATPNLIAMAIDKAVMAQEKWDREPFEYRFKIWERAANLMAKEYRSKLVASTMLGQSKTVIQAEIDAAAELVDFFRFNAFHAKELLKYKPYSENPKVTLNSFRYRGIEGFVAAITPFNFTAIGGNLAFTPALMGNAVVWKPSDSAILSNYTIFKILREAGLPPGVVNFVPADGFVFGQIISGEPTLAGVNFTGSAMVFNQIWRRVSGFIDRYKTYPRLVGECGGKNYHLIHPSADVKSAVIATVKSAFEYCGQKCSACSRLYVPKSLWPEFKETMLCVTSELKMGDPTVYENFMGAVINFEAFDRITRKIHCSARLKDCNVIAGGKFDKSVGYFIEPTIIETTDPDNELLVNEIFGPVLGVYVYKDEHLPYALNLADNTTPYALTGAVFAQDREFLKFAMERLKMSAGNFYINDKSTGAVVGQQPFGGGRKSGTNDKAGGPHYVLRFTSPQSVKETFVPQETWKYPYMDN